MNYNEKAINFFGEEIVEKIEIQHQDGYPEHYERINYNQWQFGSTGEYIVPFEDKKYKVIVQDNVLKSPLYINVITNWEEVY